MVLIIPLAFVLVMLGGMGLTAFEAYEGVGCGMLVVGFVGGIASAGMATQST